MAWSAADDDTVAFSWTEKAKRKAEADDAAWANAWRLCRCEMGQRADLERWLPALAMYVFKHGRLPGPNHERQVRSLGMSRDVDVADLDAESKRDKRPMNLGPMMDRLRKAMLDRHSRLVFGKQAIDHAFVIVTEGRNAVETNYDVSIGPHRPYKLSDEARGTVG